MTNDDLQTWDGAAADWDGKVAHADSYRTALITAALDKLLPDVAGRKILDAGCGNGYYAHYLSQRGALVKAMDGSAEMVRIAQARYPELRFSKHDFMSAIPEADASLDLVLANMLLMHMAEVGTFLKESARILKPGGRLVFSVLHPAFNYPAASLHKSMWQKLTMARPSLKLDDYFAKGAGRFESHMGRHLTHYHRTIQEYSEAVADSGLLIRTLAEPNVLTPDVLAANPKLEYAQRFPRFIFFNCIKP